MEDGLPTTVDEIFKAVGVPRIGAVPWSQKLPTTQSGVYVVSLSCDPNEHLGISELAPIDLDLVSDWIARVPGMRLDGEPPTVDLLTSRLSEFWLPDESIVYIGKATSLRKRVSQYYATQLGKPRPHAGGHWVKTLSLLSKMFVHFGEVGDCEKIEAKMLKAFSEGVSVKTRQQLRDRNHLIPFANLEFPRGNRKAHGIRKAKL